MHLYNANAESLSCSPYKTSDCIVYIAFRTLKDNNSFISGVLVGTCQKSGAVTNESIAE